MILKNGGSLCPLVGIIFEFTADGRSVVEWLSALPPSKKLFDLQKSCLTISVVQGPQWRIASIHFPSFLFDFFSFPSLKLFFGS